MHQSCTLNGSALNDATTFFKTDLSRGVVHSKKSANTTQKNPKNPKNSKKSEKSEKFQKFRKLRKL